MEDNNPSMDTSTDLDGAGKAQIDKRKKTVFHLSGDRKGKLEFHDCDTDRYHVFSSVNSCVKYIRETLRMHISVYMVQKLLSNGHTYQGRLAFRYIRRRRESGAKKRKAAPSVPPPPPPPPTQPPLAPKVLRIKRKVPVPSVPPSVPIVPPPPRSSEIPIVQASIVPLPIATAFVPPSVPPSIPPPVVRQPPLESVPTSPPDDRPARAPLNPDPVEVNIKPDPDMVQVKPEPEMPDPRAAAEPEPYTVQVKPDPGTPPPPWPPSPQVATTGTQTQLAAAEKKPDTRSIATSPIADLDIKPGKGQFRPISTDEEDYSREFHQASNTVANQQIRIQNLLEERTLLVNKIDVLQSSINELKKQGKITEADKKELESKLLSANKLAEDMTNKLNTEVKKYKDMALDFEARLNAPRLTPPPQIDPQMEMDLKQALSDLRAAQTSKQVYQDLLKQWEKDYENLEKEKAELQKMKKPTSNRPMDDTTRKEYEAELLARQTRIDNLAELLAKSEEELKYRQKELGEVLGYMQEMDAALNAARTENAKLYKEYEEVSRMNNQYATNYNDLLSKVQEEFPEMQSKIESAMQENSQLMQTIEEQQKHIQDLYGELQRLSEEANRDKVEKNELEAKLFSTLEEFANTRKELDATIQMYRQQMDSRTQELKSEYESKLQQRAQTPQPAAEPEPAVAQQQAQTPQPAAEPEPAVAQQQAQTPQPAAEPEPAVAQQQAQTPDPRAAAEPDVLPSVPMAESLSQTPTTKRGREEESIIEDEPCPKAQKTDTHQRRTALVTLIHALQNSVPQEEWKNVLTLLENSGVACDDRVFRQINRARGRQDTRQTRQMVNQRNKFVADLKEMMNTMQKYILSTDDDTGNIVGSGLADTEEIQNEIDEETPYKGHTSNLVAFAKKDVVDPMPLFYQEQNQTQNPFPSENAQPTLIDIDRQRTSEDATLLKAAMKEDAQDKTTSEIEKIAAENISGSGLYHVSTDLSEPTVQDNKDLAYEIRVYNKSRKVKHIDPILDPNIKGSKTKEEQYTGFRRPRPSVSIPSTFYSTEPSRNTRLLVDVQNGKDTTNKWVGTKPWLIEAMKVANNEKQYERLNVANTSIAGATINSQDTQIFESMLNPGKSNTTQAGTVDPNTGEVTSTAVDDEVKDLAIGTASTLEATDFYNNIGNQPMVNNTSINKKANLQSDKEFNSPALENLNTADESKMESEEEDTKARKFLTFLELPTSEINISLVKNALNQDINSELQLRQTPEQAQKRQAAADLIVSHANQKGYGRQVQQFLSQISTRVQPHQTGSTAVSSLTPFAVAEKGEMMTGSGSQQVGFYTQPYANPPYYMGNAWPQMMHPQFAYPYYPPPHYPGYPVPPLPMQTQHHPQPDLTPPPPPAKKQRTGRARIFRP
jgi:hypothetical protein